MDMCGALFLSLGWLMQQSVNGGLDYLSQGQAMQLQGDFSIAGFFPVHYGTEESGSLPALSPCNK